MEMVKKHTKEWGEVRQRLYVRTFVPKGWRPPVSDVIKINFDGALQRSTKESCTRLIRDEPVICACIEDIKKLKEAFHTYCFSYTTRERNNGLAHILATEGLKRKEQIYLVKHGAKIWLKGYLGENDDQFFKKLKRKR
ncbi:hypothetical protein PVK06_013982 [Gossypium arboreum]|uniref:Reverse transcriptase n=1 Tax=Gossypium arboreum TaxID=29729 RepID=A0ABR0PT68_GOSAR|nr:hypothetical protein PVK06_013982 [Gossypium arboreum]